MTVTYEGVVAGCQHCKVLLGTALGQDQVRLVGQVEPHPGQVVCGHHEPAARVAGPVVV